MKKTNVVDVLIKILSRYHLVCIQEIRDTDGDSVKKLMELLNRRQRSAKYLSIVGDRLGKSNSKEQYGIIYRENQFSLSNARTYPGYQTRFERPPMQVHVRPKQRGLPEFELLVVHLDPHKVMNEMDALYEIAETIRKQGKKNIMIVGDMNAGCSYLSKRRKSLLKFSKDSRYTWFIGDDVDTTVGKNNCAYDRIIVHGEELKQALVKSSAKAYRFPQELGLSEQQAVEVSDHYPIEIKMKRLRGGLRRKTYSG